MRVDLSSFTGLQQNEFIIVILGMVLWFFIEFLQYETFSKTEIFKNAQHFVLLVKRKKLWILFTVMFFFIEWEKFCVLIFEKFCPIYSHARQKHGTCGKKQFLLIAILHFLNIFWILKIGVFLTEFHILYFNILIVVISYRIPTVCFSWDIKR